MKIHKVKMLQVKGGSYTRAEFDVPNTCDLCGTYGLDGIVDGKTKDRGWAYLCVPCHASKGTGFGAGRGQLYAVPEAFPATGSLSYAAEDELIRKLVTQAATAHARAMADLYADDEKHWRDHTPGAM